MLISSPSVLLLLLPTPLLLFEGDFSNHHTVEAVVSSNNADSLLRKRECLFKSCYRFFTLCSDELRFELIHFAYAAAAADGAVYQRANHGLRLYS